MKRIVIALAGLMFFSLASGAEPTELGTLRGRWKSARSEAVEPVDAKYREALAAMKRRFDGSGDHEAAASVELELRALSALMVESGRTARSTGDPAGASVRITTPDEVKVEPLQQGRPRLYDSDPQRVIEGVDGALSDWQFTSVPQRNVNSYRIEVRKPGTIYCFGSSRTPIEEIFGREAGMWIQAKDEIRGRALHFCYKRSFPAGARLDLAGFEVQIAAAELELVSGPSFVLKGHANLEDRLQGSRWSWPEKAFEKEVSWFRLNEDGSTTSGWHPNSGTWKVRTDNSIEIMVTKFPTNLVLEFDTKVTRGTLKGGDITKTCRRLD